MDDSNQWTSSFDNLPVYEHGVEIEYTIQEQAVSGYRTHITGESKTGYIVSNVLIPQEPIKPFVPKPQTVIPGLGISTNSLDLIFIGLGLVLIVISIRHKRRIK
ncbi:hypothetical protein AOC36_02305 [Erysipelothrix larvae]|uniref:CNA-B domain-containing protein n=1 Tax=Erysipelothrix larvae TaxID=1514105 RepID=A0A0X8GYP7_9FIRM|nr:hypothetical protein AOC36_02305 [Erysipelothrix larvae]